MYAEGTPCWVDVASTDLDRSIDFYTALFGWDAERLGEEAGGYVMFRSGGKLVAAAGPSQTGADYWMVYLATPDADAVAARVRDAGGTVVAEPFDVMDAGRMAVFQDPLGASFSVWQAGQMEGAELRHEPVSLTWVECQTPDRDAATAFYTAVFGYDTQDADMPGGTYRLLEVGSDSVAGMWPIGPELEGVPPNWSTVFAVADCDATTARCSELGGSAVTQPMDIHEVGRFAVLRDPAGAVFQVLQSA